MDQQSFRITHLPYCLARLGDGHFLPLNRNYKPVGTTSREWVDYETHPDRVKLRRLGPKTQAKLHAGARPIPAKGPAFIHLYTDESCPGTSTKNNAAYFAKIAILASMRA